MASGLGSVTFQVDVRSISVHSIAGSNPASLRPFLKLDFDHFKTWSTAPARGSEASWGSKTGAEEEEEEEEDGVASFVYTTRYPERLPRKTFTAELVHYNSWRPNVRLGAVGVDLHTLATGPAEHRRLPVRDGGAVVAYLSMRVRMVQVADLQVNVKGLEVSSAAVEGIARKVYVEVSYSGYADPAASMRRARDEGTTHWPYLPQLYVKTTFEDAMRHGVMVRFRENVSWGADRTIAEGLIPIRRHFSFVDGEESEFDLPLNSSEDGRISGSVYYRNFPQFAQMRAGWHDFGGIHAARPADDDVVLPNAPQCAVNRGRSTTTRVASAASAARRNATRVREAAHARHPHSVATASAAPAPAPLGLPLPPGEFQATFTRPGSLGLNITPVTTARHGTLLKVTEVIAGGQAAANGMVRVGHCVTSVNGQAVAPRSAGDAIGLLSDRRRPLTVWFSTGVPAGAAAGAAGAADAYPSPPRTPAGSAARSPARSFGAYRTLDPADADVPPDAADSSEERGVLAGALARTDRPPLPQFWERVPMDDGRVYFKNHFYEYTCWELPTSPEYLVTFAHPGSLGMKLKPTVVDHVMVMIVLHVAPGSAAANAGCIRVGHRVIEANGRSLASLTRDQALRMVADPRRPITLRLADPCAVSQSVAAAHKA